MSGGNKPRTLARDISESLGKLPPQVLNFEEAILGGILLEKNALTKVMSILEPNHFYLDAHGEIFSAIKSLYSQSKQVDMRTVVHELRTMGKLEVVGGAFYIAELTSKVSSSSGIEEKCRIVIEYSMKRDLIQLASQVHHDAYEDETDVFELITNIEKGLLAVSSHVKSQAIIKMRDAMLEMVKDIASRTDMDYSLTGVPSGFRSLDRITHGWQKSDLIILAGRPGSGKTSCLLSMLRNAAVDFNKPVAIISLEMSRLQLVRKLSSIESELSLKKIKNDKFSPLDWDQLTNKTAKLTDSPLYMVDPSSMNTSELRSICRQLKQRYKIEMIGVDYLQLLRGDKELMKRGNREQEISSISRTLKEVAKELDVPVIALSQLSREVEKRGGPKIPQLSDLRESGCLSMDTSFIYTSTGVQTNVASPIKLLSLNGNKITVMDSKNLPRKPREVFRLKLSSGRFVDATANHPVLTSDGYKQLHDIQLTDSVACGANFSIKNSKHIPEAKFIGWMLGNGSMYGYGVPSFITPDPIVADHFCSFIKKRFGFIPKDHPHYHSKVYQYDCTNSPTGNRTKIKNPVTLWLKENDLWGRKAQEKYIPEWMMAGDDESICELLAGLWETDGCISLGKKKQVISYASTSFIMMQQIQFLLVRLGIFCHVDDGYLSDKATTPCYKLVINNYQHQKKFSDKIKLVGKKSDKIKLITEKKETTGYFDKIGRGTTELIAKKIDVALPHELRIQLHNGRRMTKRHLLKIQAYLSKIKNNSLDKFKWLTQDTIIWDTVESIHSIGVKEIFDRHVPVSNNFIANGIIVHNSLEQDSDIVSFLWRPEYYKIEGDDSGTFTQGLTKLIIAKHRNGSVDDAYLTFVGHTTAFKDCEHVYTHTEPPQGYSPLPNQNANTPTKDEDTPF